MLQSYLNMLRIVQMTADETSRIEFKIKVKAVDDPDVVQKVSILGKFKKTQLLVEIKVKLEKKLNIEQININPSTKEMPTYIEKWPFSLKHEGTVCSLIDFI